MRTPLIAANWKMHLRLDEAEALLMALVQGLPASAKLPEVALLPAFVYLELTKKHLQGTSLVWGAQTVSAFDMGAYTGEVSAKMLQSLGCRYALLGHSERRRYFAESGDVLIDKWRRLKEQGIWPILCIGETLDERQLDATQAVIEQQLGEVLDVLGVEVLKEAVVAYEPVWAIGTGKTATPDMAQATHAMIRAVIQKRDPKIAENLRILYGGSVNANNAEALLAMPDIDGALVGGASLDAAAFMAIVQVAERGV